MKDTLPLEPVTIQVSFAVTAFKTGGKTMEKKIIQKQTVFLF